MQQQGPWQGWGETPEGGSGPAQQHMHIAHDGLQWQHNKTLAKSFGRKAPTLPEVTAPVNTPFSTDYSSGLSGPNWANYSQQPYNGRQQTRTFFPKPPVWRQIQS